eukprot:765138-Hanusia_phi.AAC.2
MIVSPRAVFSQWHLGPGTVPRRPRAEELDYFPTRPGTMEPGRVKPELWPGEIPPEPRTVRRDSRLRGPREFSVTEWHSLSQ